MLALIEEFIDYLSDVKRYSEHTISSYASDLGGFIEYCNTTYEIMDINEINHLIIRSFIVTLKQEGQTATTINRKISSLRSFYKYLKQQEKISKNPMLKVQALKKPKRLPSYVPEKKMEHLLEKTIDDDSFSTLRRDLIVTLFYVTGMRRSELINIKLSDIDYSRKDIKVLGKGNKERSCPISEGLIALIEIYLDKRGERFPVLDHDYLIITDGGKKAYPKLIYNIVSNLLKSVNAAEKNSPHVLRHTFATHLSSNGAELNAVKELLGHSSLAATQVYTHNSIERLKSEYNKAHPKQ